MQEKVISACYLFELGVPDPEPSWNDSSIWTDGDATVGCTIPEEVDVFCCMRPDEEDAGTIEVGCGTCVGLITAAVGTGALFEAGCLFFFRIRINSNIANTRRVIMRIINKTELSAVTFF